MLRHTMELFFAQYFSKEDITLQFKQQHKSDQVTPVVVILTSKS